MHGQLSNHHCIIHVSQCQYLSLLSVSISEIRDVVTVQMENLHPRVTEIHIYDLIMTVLSKPPISIRLVPFPENRSDRKGLKYALISFLDSSDANRVFSLHHKASLEGMRIQITLDDARNIRKDESLKHHTTALMISNLPRSVQYIGLLVHLSSISKISTKPKVITLHHHPFREDYPSSAYVECATTEDATLCIERLNLTELEGQRMWVRGCRVRINPNSNSDANSKNEEEDASTSRWSELRGKSCTVSLCGFHDLVSYRECIRIGKTSSFSDTNCVIPMATETECQFVSYPKDIALDNDGNDTELASQWRAYRLQKAIPDEVRTWIEWLYFGGTLASSSTNEDVHCIRNVEVVLDAKGQWTNRINLEMISPEAAATVFDLIHHRMYNGHCVRTTYGRGPCCDLTIRMCPIKASITESMIRNWIQNEIREDEVEYIHISKPQHIRDEDGEDITELLDKSLVNEVVMALTSKRALFKCYDILCGLRGEMALQIEEWTVYIGIEVMQIENQKQMNYREYHRRSSWLQINNLESHKIWKQEIEDWIHRKLKALKKGLKQKDIRQIYVYHHEEGSGRPGYALVHCKGNHVACKLMEGLNGRRLAGNVVDIKYLEQSAYDRYHQISEMGLEFIVLFWPKDGRLNGRKWSKSVYKMMMPFPRPTKFEIVNTELFPMGAARMQFGTTKEAQIVFEGLDGQRIGNNTLRTTLRSPMRWKKRIIRRDVLGKGGDGGGAVRGRNVVRRMDVTLQELKELKGIKDGKARRCKLHKVVFENIKKAKNGKSLKQLSTKKVRKRKLL